MVVGGTIQYHLFRSFFGSLPELRGCALSQVRIVYRLRVALPRGNFGTGENTMARN